MWKLFGAGWSSLFGQPQASKWHKIEGFGHFDKTFAVYWPKVTDQMRRAWKDYDDATEYGACCVAILLILKLTDYTVIERSRKGTGFDYWLGEKGTLLFQQKARLEVSGIRKGDNNEINARSSKKTKQIIPSNNTGLPAYIVIVEFSSPQSRVDKT